MSASSSSSSSSVAASAQPFLGNVLRNSSSLGITGSGGGAFMESPASDGFGKRLLEQQGLRDAVGGTLSDIDEDIGGGDGGNMSDDEWVPKQLRKGPNAGKSSKASRRKVAGADFGMGRSGSHHPGRLPPANVGDLEAAAMSFGSNGGNGSSSSNSSSSDSRSGGDVALGTGAGGVSGLTLFSAGDPAAIVRQLRHAFALVQVNSTDVISHQQLYRASIFIYFFRSLACNERSLSCVLLTIFCCCHSLRQVKLEGENGTSMVLSSGTNFGRGAVSLASTSSSSSSEPRRCGRSSEGGRLVLHQWAAQTDAAIVHWKVNASSFILIGDCFN